MQDQLSEKVIGAAYQVHNELGFGFLETVYERSLSIELCRRRVPHSTQSAVDVFYKEQTVGRFVADLTFGNDLLVELKSVVNLLPIHEQQLVHYLTATNIEVGLLINFGPEKVEVRRKYRTYRKPPERRSAAR